MWEKNRKESRCVHRYNWVTLLYSRSYPNIVNQLYFNKTLKNEKKSGENGDIKRCKTAGSPLWLRWTCLETITVIGVQRRHQAGDEASVVHWTKEGICEAPQGAQSRSWVWKVHRPETWWPLCRSLVMTLAPCNPIVCRTCTWSRKRLYYITLLGEQNRLHIKDIPFPGARWGTQVSEPSS